MIDNVLISDNFIHRQQKKIVVNQGGTYSMKTWSILILLLVIATTEANSRITVTGQSIPNLKRGAYRDICNILGTPDYARFNDYIVKHNIAERVIYFKNGSFIEFVVFTSEQDARNGKRDYLFINEANGMKYEICRNLILKTEKNVFIDYNPSAPFWVHDKILIRPDAVRIISDHRINNYISQEIHNEIESITDPNWHRVYARGMTGAITGLCFPNWKILDNNDWQNEVKQVIYGIDYGYTNDPTAIVKVNVISKNEVVLEELLYTPSDDDQFIYDILTKSGAQVYDYIYTDHDKQVSSLLRRRGLQNVTLAKKNDKGFDILKMQQITVFYTKSSTNIHFERARYKFKQSDDVITNIPDDSTAHHCMDAARYAIYTHWLKFNLFL